MIIDLIDKSIFASLCKLVKNELQREEKLLCFSDDAIYMLTHFIYEYKEGQAKCKFKSAFRLQTGIDNSINAQKGINELSDLGYLVFNSNNDCIRLTGETTSLADRITLEW